jgi:ribosomal protein S18 acetylase RimI-like enzyme
MNISSSPLTSELKNEINEHLRKHASKFTGGDGLGEQIAFEARENKEFVGCVVVQLFWGQLHIKYLVVKEAYRGQGIGRKLMEHAFEFGKSNMCSFAFVETMVFQAPPFYQKLGFKIDFIRFGYEKEISFYYLSKDLIHSPSPDLSLQPLTQGQIPTIVNAFSAHHWSKEKTLFETYLKESQEGDRLIWVAYEKGQFAGYITLKWNSHYAPFQKEKIPEISDLNVLPSFQKRGIASALLHAAEHEASKKSTRVGIGVGLSKDYGPAQKLYIKQGYQPDGLGVTYKYDSTLHGSNVYLDDDLVLWLTKQLT